MISKSSKYFCLNNIQMRRLKEHYKDYLIVKDISILVSLSMYDTTEGLMVTRITGFLFIQVIREGSQNVGLVESQPLFSSVALERSDIGEVEVSEGHPQLSHKKERSVISKDHCWCIPAPLSDSLLVTSLIK